MTDKKKLTNTAFSQQQRAQISNACERVQNAININNSTLAELNADLVRKADEIAIKWKAYGLPYNAIRDAAIEMAMWQKEQMMKSAVDATCVLLPPPDVFKVLICHEVTDKLTVGQKVKVIFMEDEQCSTE